MAQNKIQEFEQTLVKQLGSDKGRAIAQTFSRFVLDAVKAGVESVSPGIIVPLEDILLGKAEDAALAAEDAELKKLAAPSPAPSSPAPAQSTDAVAAVVSHPSFLTALEQVVSKALGK